MAEEPAVAFQGNLQDVGFEIGLPAGVFAVVLYVKGAQEEGGLYAFGHGMELRNHGTALAGNYLEGVSLYVGCGKV